MTITWKEGKHSMTANQIAYWSLAENRDYHSKVTAENARHNLASERLQGEMNAETGRHNRESESIAWANFAEVQRHNVANERQQVAELAEVQRHNVANERQQVAALNETIRHNKRAELEQVLYNAATAAIQMRQIDESIRHNKAIEDVQRASEIRQQKYSDWSMQHQNLQLIENTAKDLLTVGNQWYNSFQNKKRNSQGLWSNIIGTAGNVFGALARAGLLS